MMKNKPLITFLGGFILCLSWLLPVTAAPLNHPPFNTTSLQRLRAKAKARTYRFVVTGDNREGNTVFRKILNQAQHYQPDFMLHSGDFVPRGSYLEYQQFSNILYGVPFPLLFALGNHEIYNPQGRKWFQQFMSRQTYFAFDIGPDRFIVADNANGDLSPGQLRWLEVQLQLRRRYKFVVMHMPPRNVIWFHAFGGPGAIRLLQLVEKYQVNYAFFGHIHIYDEMISNGVHYVVSGGAGAPMFQMPLYISPQGGAFPHFLVMDVSDKGIRQQLVKF